MKPMVRGTHGGELTLLSLEPTLLSLRVLRCMSFRVFYPKVSSSARRNLVKYSWNKPAIYVAANQFHHKHEDIFVCDMFDVVDMDIEFASGSQEAYCLCYHSGKCISTHREVQDIFPKSSEARGKPTARNVSNIISNKLPWRTSYFGLQRCALETPANCMLYQTPSR